MRAAPAVRVSVRPGAVARGVPALLALLATASLAAWALGHCAACADHGVRPALAWMPALAAAALAWRRGAGPGHELAWDGVQWHRDGQPGQVTLQLDLQQLVLLRWQAQDPRVGAGWLVPTAAQCGADWHALRVALRAAAGPARLDPPVAP